MSLQHLFRPKRVAVVGVSDTPGKFGHSAAWNLLRSDLEAVYFVHPTKTEVLGHPCYPSLTELPGVVDCVAVCTPSQTILPILTEAAALHIPAAVVFASGFAEQDAPESRDMERQLLDLARDQEMHVLGPNCLGIYNAVDSVYLWGMNGDHAPEPQSAGIGVVAHSGWIVETYVHTPHVRVAYGISTGNGQVVTLEECMAFLVDQPAVNVISVYVEGLHKPDVFVQALRKAALQRKPVVVLKGGRSELGAASAASHTANMMSSHAAFESLLKKYGAILVDDFDQLITLSHALNVLGPDLPTLPAYGGITLSGGENTIFADLGTAAGIALPAFSDRTKERLRAHLPAFATPHNPCDATTHLFFNTKAVVGALQAVDSDPNIAAVFVSTNIDLAESAMWRHFCEAVAAAKKGCAKPILAIPASEGSRNPVLRSILEDAGIPMLGAPKTSFRCLKHLADFVSYDTRSRSFDLPARAGAAQVGRPTALSELDSKAAIAAAGIPIPAQILVEGPDEAGAAASGIGFPVALKINSPDILHKTDVGGVRLNINSEPEAVEAYQSILENVTRRQPDARVEGILVQEMLPPGLEMILGITHDPQLGSFIMVGLGGVYVELFEDTALYPLPLNEQEACELLLQLRAFPLLEGLRGGKPRDVEALVSMMVRLSDFASESGRRVKEVDLNPVMVYEAGKGATAADALIVEWQGE